MSTDRAQPKHKKYNHYCDISSMCEFLRQVPHLQLLMQINMVALQKLCCILNFKITITLPTCCWLKHCQRIWYIILTIQTRTEQKQTQNTHSNFEHNETQLKNQRFIARVFTYHWSVKIYIAS